MTDSPKPSKFDPAKLFAIQEEYARLQRLTALRIKSNEQRENCLLCVASALLRLNGDLGVSWERIAEVIPGISDRGHAYKIARRQVGLTATSYKLITDAINRVLISYDQKEISFPAYPQSLK